MSPGRVILRSAGLLVPAPQRPEWFAEWHAELCYIEQTSDSRALAFCFGAFKDAFWFRRQCRFRWLDSPVQCLSLLALIAIVSVFGARPGLSLSPFRDASGLVTGRQTGQPPAGAAFYRKVDEAVRVPRGATLLSVVHGSGNLFEVLRVPVPRPGRTPIVILGRMAWWSYFGSDRRVAGHILEIDGKQALIAGVIPDDAWPLPGRIDVWLLEDQLPPDPKQLVVARSSESGLLRRPARRVREAFQTFGLWILLGCMMSPPTTRVTGVRHCAFLLAKIGLILPAIYSWASLASTCATPLTMFLAFWAVCPGSILALRWALKDQHRRCPVCLRLLSNPVRFGKASQTFLDWYGTERMCERGHGVLRVPETAGSFAEAQQWVGLDELCVR